MLSASDYWLWGILGSLIIVGPFIYMYKYLKAINTLCADFNHRGQQSQRALRKVPYARDGALGFLASRMVIPFPHRTDPVKSNTDSHERCGFSYLPNAVASTAPEKHHGLHYLY